MPKRRTRSLRCRLELFAVERRERERRDIDLVEATDVDGDHFGAVRGFSPRERFDAAARTEQVVDHLLVELVVREVPLARTERELLGLDERPQRAALGADRAV